jgi:hypothetical protein
LVILEGQKQNGWRGFYIELRSVLEPCKTINIETVVAAKPTAKNTQQDGEKNLGNKVVVGSGPISNSGWNLGNGGCLSWRSQLFPHMENTENRKWQKRDSSVSGGEAGKENLVGFGAKISDGINAKNEVVFNLKIKLIYGMDGH